MTIKQFIEKAIEGGIKFGLEHWELDYYDGEQCDYELCIEKIVLDPKAWQAVGKVEGKKWKGHWCKKCKEYIHFHGSVCEEFHPDQTIGQGAAQMHAMIDHLIQGGTIESYFETL